MITMYYNKNKKGKYALFADCGEGITKATYNWFFMVGQLLGDRFGGGETPSIGLFSEKDCHKYKRLISVSCILPEDAALAICHAIGRKIKE